MILSIGAHVDGADAQLRGDDRADGGAAGRVVAHDEVLN